MAYPITDQNFLAQTVQLTAVNTTKQAIPHAWYQHLVNEQGKVQLNAVTILSEIVYWYSPVPVYDRQTKTITNYQKKFKEDILQKSYRELSIKFSLTKNQVKSAILFLEKKDLIERDIRNINQDSTPINNVLYINLKFEKLLEIYQIPEKSTFLKDEEIDDACFSEEEIIEELDVKKEDSEVSNPTIQHICTQETNITEKEENQESYVISSLSQNLACNANLSDQKNISPEKKFGGRGIILDGGVSKKLHTYTYTFSKTTPSCNKSLNSGRSLTFSKEENLFLEELLAIKPHEGKPIEKSSATWWIKSFGLDAVKTAVAVYWQRVNKALKCFWFKGPKDIGGTIRHALDNKTPVYQTATNHSKAIINNNLESACGSKYATQNQLKAAYEPETINQESLKSVNQAEFSKKNDLEAIQTKKEEDLPDVDVISQSELEVMLQAEIEAIYQPRSMSQEKQEVIQEKVEVALQSQATVYKPVENLLQKQLETITKSKVDSIQPTKVIENESKPSQTMQKPLLEQTLAAKIEQDPAQIIQKPLIANAAQKAFMYFNEDEKKCLRYLLNYVPAKGEKIPETEATWWIKEFGVAKVKTAMQVYAQQVEKASKGMGIEMPRCIGGYVRNALNQGLQPCREMDIRNKGFAEEFKKQMNWAELVITEKYCSAKNTGKDWLYNLNEALFKQSLREFYENYFSDPSYVRAKL
jgi:hypothetical protein